MNMNKLLGNNIWLNKRQELLAIFSILVMAFLLRIYKLGSESLWRDEALTIYIAEKPIAEIISLASSSIHPPLHYIVSHFWINIFGSTEIATRFLSVIFGVFSIYVIYRIGKLLFNKEIGILSAFILSISLFHIRYSQEMRSYSLLVLLVLLSNYYFIKMLREKETKITNKNTIGYVISTVAMAYTHVFGLFYLIFQNIYYLIRRRSKKDVKYWAKIQGLTLLLFIPWVPVLIGQVTRVVSEDGLWISRPDLGDLYKLFQSFSGNDISILVFVVICIIGLTILREQEKVYIYWDVFVLGWLFIPIMLSFIISQVSAPIFWDRYLIASLPALVLLVSHAIFNFQKYSLVSMLLVAIILINIPSINAYYQYDEKEQWRDVVKYIEDNKKDGDIVLVYPTHGIHGFDYYYKNTSDVYFVNGSYEIKNKIRRNNGIWFVSTKWLEPKSTKESRLIEEELSKIYAKIDNRDFIDVSVYYYKKLDKYMDKDVLFLYQKNWTNWSIVKSGSWGMLEYNITGTIFNYSFSGYNLKPDRNYSIIYGIMLYDKKSELKFWTYITQNLSDNQGNINMMGSYNLDICSYSNIDPQIIIRLIPSDDYGILKKSMIRWNLDDHLFEDDRIECPNKETKEV